MELNSGNLGIQCEAVIAVLQGLMSSEVVSRMGFPIQLKSKKVKIGQERRLGRVSPQERI